MDYKHFSISAFEREPGRWRARVRRVAFIQSRAKLIEFVTEIDSVTAADAMKRAMKAIDRRGVSRSATGSERFWRLSRRRKSSAVQGERRGRRASQKYKA
jgi:hypothetical protein